MTRQRIRIEAHKKENGKIKDVENPLPPC